MKKVSATEAFFAQEPLLERGRWELPEHQVPEFERLMQTVRENMEMLERRSEPIGNRDELLHNGEVWRRFHRWQITLSSEEADDFWDDICWLWARERTLTRVVEVPGQSRRGSAIEIGVNYTIGFLLAWLTNAIVLHAMGFEASVAQNFWMTVVFTIVSVARSYGVRRGFNWLHRTGRLK